MEEVISSLLNNGIAGVMLAFFVWYLSKRDREYMQERERFYSHSKESHAQLVQVIENNNEALSDMRDLLRSAECKFSKH